MTCRLPSLLVMVLIAASALPGCDRSSAPPSEVESTPDSLKPDRDSGQPASPDAVTAPGQVTVEQLLHKAEEVTQRGLYDDALLYLQWARNMAKTDHAREQIQVKISHLAEVKAHQKDFDAPGRPNPRDSSDWHDRQLRNERLYNECMDKGEQLLNQGLYDQAKKQFTEAGKLPLGAEMVKKAMDKANHCDTLANSKKDGQQVPEAGKLPDEHGQQAAPSPKAP